MLKLSQVFIKRLFCAPPLKPNHHYSELELKQLLNEPNQLRENIKEQIQKMGQLTIPSYWRQALTDAQHGYYRKSNVFSKEGDFTTAPQISPLFGQMVATWLAVFLQTQTVNILDPYTNQAKKPFRIVELGPGRGMLMQDILRSFHAYKIDNHFELSFI